ncbi:MAG: aminoacyl-tRNA hydrolase [Clostridia bacterium]|nr:aminoacyl-tRNA hydrolase [Clostridia bacterium]
MLSIFRRKKESAPSAPPEFLVVGLGNPGAQYAMTRHNAGWLAVDRLAEQCGAGRLTRTKCRATYAECTIGGRRVLLMKPQTFMNLSGEAVRDMAAAFSVPPERIIVVFDDISLAAGRLRLRREGSAGGHNGIKSIIYQLGTDKFPRVKIGIGAHDRAHGEELSDFVLDTLDADAWDGVKRAPEAVCAIITQGIDLAMQEFNSAAKS